MDSTYRKNELRIHALGAAISRRDWHAVEQAHAAIRDNSHEFAQLIEALERRGEILFGREGD
jgi:predicted short-subunit dehydrogenase-like oxidoreductase (DUF2520 family)